MASYTKYEDFVQSLMLGEHGSFAAAGDVLKVALTNTAPTVGTDNDLADITEIGAGNGYTAGGTDVQNDQSETGGTLTVTATDVVFTASGGTIGPFRYVVLYNDTHSTDALLAYWDYGSSITLQDGETFTVDFGASLFTLV